MIASLAPAPLTIVDVDLDDLPDGLDGAGWIRLVVWSGALCLGGTDLAPDRLPLTDLALRDAALDAALPAIWGHLFASDAEYLQQSPPASLDDVRSIPDPLDELHRRLDVPPGPVEDVSVLVCTRDRPEELDRCLRALRAIDHPPGEIVVVDNASVTAATKEVVDRHSDVIYVREERPGLDVARNTAVAVATRDIVAFVDDDVEVHATWLGQLRQGFDDDVVAVTGLVLPRELDTPAQVVFEQQWGLGKGFVPRTYGPALHARQRRKGTPAWEVGAGANMAFRRRVFSDIGDFDPRLDVGAAGCSGDSELWYRILASGERIRYVPTAVVRHRHRRESADLRAQIRAYMRGHTAALLVQHQVTGDRGNLVRLGVVIPRNWLRSAAAVASGSLHPQRSMLRDEIAGAISGVRYHLAHR